MYRLHNSSEHSGVTNMYSLSASRSGTPTQGNQTSGFHHNNPHTQVGTGMGILVGGVNHPSHNASHAASSLAYNPQIHNHTASQFTLQLDELDQMQMIQQQAMDGQTNGGMSHSLTLPHNLSHRGKTEIYKTIKISIFILV